MQQFTIESQKIRDKLNNLLPSQNVGGIGVELTGSTQIVPIVDLTEIAEGSALRSDLQTALGFGVTLTTGTGSSGTQTVVNTTGYYRIMMNYMIFADGGATQIELNLNDGASTQTVYKAQVANGRVSDGLLGNDVDFVVFLSSGKSLEVTANGGADCRYNIVSRQIADLSGNLTNPI